MARPASKHPTELELEILKILWREGPSPGRTVRDALVGFRDLAYTSVMTILNIMVDKGYLRRRKRGGRYRYEARVTQEATTRRMLKDIVERAFDGSAATVMLKLLETADIEDDELVRLRELVTRRLKGKKP